MTRLFCVLARENDKAVIFRRGPSKHVQLILWQRSTDQFQFGQWFKGRIYERRADLSPDGNYLVYFAGNQKPPYRTWTAISKPPYLTALAHWPNGSTWGGGGLFEENWKLSLNQSDQLATGFDVPKKLSIQPLEANLLNEEGAGIYRIRMLRDGWQLLKSEVQEQQFSKQFEKSILQLKTEIGARSGDGPFHYSEYEIAEKDQPAYILDEFDWADFDHNGDFLFTRKGLLFRAKLNQKNRFELEKAKLLYDFNSGKFEEKEAPSWAKQW